LHECKTTKDWSGGYLPIAMCGHKGEKLRTKLGAPEIVHSAKPQKKLSNQSNVLVIVNWQCRGKKIEKKY